MNTNFPGILNCELRRTAHDRKGIFGKYLEY